MKIAILGYGAEGRAACEYWQSGPNQLTVCDQNKSVELPGGVQHQLGADYLQDLERFDLIVRSPAVHPRDIVAANSPEVLRKVTSNTNEFFKVCPSRNIIGVTGTKGKGTTATLIAKTLEVAGKRVHLGGNIGIAPLELLKDNIKAPDWVVLELANFQLIDLRYSPHIAVCLMVVPEHLDWHENIEDYIRAKQQLFAHQIAGDIAIYYAEGENSKETAAVGSGEKIPYFATPGALVEGNQIKIAGQVICQTDEVKLLGKHNWQNVCAAVTAVWQVSQDISAIRSVLTTFAGLPHRLEFVREVDGVKFYNDSFAATPDAAVAALEAIPGTKVMIVGGFDRQLPIENLAKNIAANAHGIRKLLLIGASAERTAQTLKAAGFSNFQLSSAKTMPEIVDEARSLAQSGDAVVLSPGFPSFDMFKNFEDRGLKFKGAVNKL